MSGHPHCNFAVKKFPGASAMCAAIWRRKIYWNKSHGCSSLQSSAQAFGEVGLGKAISPQRTAKPLRVDAELGSSKAKLITLTQPENFPLSARGVRQSQEIFGPQNCGAVGQTLSAT